MPGRPRLRVALVSHSSALSGAERALLRLVEAFDRERVEPVVLLPEEGPLADALREIGIRADVQKTGWWIPATHWGADEFLDQLEDLPARCDAMTSAIAALGPDLVHTNTPVTLEGAVAAARLGLPHAWHCRGLFDRGFPPAYLDDVPFFYGAIDRLSDALVCVSSAVERQASESGGEALRIVIPDGFDPAPLLAQPLETKASLAKRLGLPATARWIVCLGGIQRRKGQRDLAAAIGQLRREYPDLVAVLAGHETDPAYAAELRAFLQENGLENAVALVGFQPEVRALLTHAEMLVHPSHSEGFTLAVLEAMALGTPVVATRSGGPEEIVEEGRSGILVDRENPRVLAQAIRDVLEDLPLRERLRAEGPTRAAQFSPTAGARHVEELYKGLAAGPRPPASRLRAAEEACTTVLDRARTAARRSARA